MPRLPRITAVEAVRAVRKAGFALARQSGSHALYRDAAGQRVTIPVHAGKVLHPKVVTSILRDAGLTVEEFEELLHG